MLGVFRAVMTVVIDIVISEDLQIRSSRVNTSKRRATRNGRANDEKHKEASSSYSSDTFSCWGCLHTQQCKHDSCDEHQSSYPCW